MEIGKRSRMYAAFIAAVFLYLGYTCAASYEKAENGRFTVVVAVKHKQFLNLYDYLIKHAVHFDPRYAGSLWTHGYPEDEHKNLHITLASTDLGTHNEQACKKALEVIAGFFDAEVHINFDAKKLKLDSEKHVILPLIKDHGYHQLVQLQQAVVYTLEQQHATGIHVKNPNHVTIGFADKLPAKPFSEKIHSGRVTHARLYHWIESSAHSWGPREEFYPIAEVKIYS